MGGGEGHQQRKEGRGLNRICLFILLSADGYGGQCKPGFQMFRSKQSRNALYIVCHDQYSAKPSFDHDKKVD